MIYLNGQPLPVTVFPDNTSQVWKLNPNLTHGDREVFVRWTYSHEGEFLQLAQLKDLLDSQNFIASLMLDYLPYGRQDKEISNTTTFALRTFAKLLNTLGFDEVVIQDPHSEIALDLIVKSRAIYPKKVLENVIFNSKITMACYPDKGAVTKYSKVYKELIGDAYIYGEKVRDQLTGNITSYEIVGNPHGENVLIVDDICDGGATFKLLAKDLLAAGAKSVALFVTHGIFSRGVKTLLDAGISKVYTRDGEMSATQDQK